MNSELRQDLVSGDWIVVAPKRAKRPDQFSKKDKRIKAPIKGCPFENPQKSGNAEPILIYPNKNNWRVQIIPNKYPALSYNSVCPKITKNGPYAVIDGVGRHDIVINRDHYKNFGHLNKKDALLVFRIFQDRYKMLSKDKCLAYVLIFDNWGPKAGASIYHPHYQIISLPVVPPDVEHSLLGSRRYFNKYKKCVHCVMIEGEKNAGVRIIYENKGAIVFAPFVSRQSFEMRIFPKRHYSYFEDMSAKNLSFIIDALQKALLRLEKKLGDPDYNFFIHTAPVLNKKKYHHYHWHIEIQPKLRISAGFELATGVEIINVDPDEAARILKA